jgi:Putative DNA-binding domain/PHP domain
MTWRRVDLHVHTPASSDYQDPAISVLDILRRAEERGLDMIALTDHNSVRGYAELWREIEDLELLEFLGRLQPHEAERLNEFRRLLQAILVLPGFEFTAQFGFHILAIFPEGTTVRMMEHLLLLLGVPEDRFGSGEVGATTDVLRAYEILADHGALVIGAHVNSTHGIAMQGLRFGGQTKIAYTQDPNLHALEVTDLVPASNRRSTARFFSGIKSEYPRRMHCIQGSDAHRLDRDPNRESNLGVGDRVTEVLLPEISFRALKDVFVSSDFGRTRPFAPPPDDPIKAARLEGNTINQAFHESVTSKRGHSAVLRDVVALANAGGGRIYLGVSAAEKRPVAGVESAQTLIAELTQEFSAQITPAVSVTFEEAVSDGKSVLILDVAEGTHKPHAVAPGGIYVRRDAESAQATRDEIVAMVTGGPQAGSRAPQAARASGASQPAKRGEAPPKAATATRPAPPRSGRAASASKPPQAKATGSPNGYADSDKVVGQPLLEIYEEEIAPDPVTPTNGIEVVDAIEQDGIRYYSLRDLRYHKLIHHVTKATDRRLWRSAITQREKGDLDEASVRWAGDFGLLRSYRQRSGDRRYDVVFRGDGDPRIFFGVSEAGMTGRWQALLDAKAIE